MRSTTWILGGLCLSILAPGIACTYEVPTSNSASSSGAGGDAGMGGSGMSSSGMSSSGMSSSGMSSSGMGGSGAGGCMAMPGETVPCNDLTDVSGTWSAFAAINGMTTITQPQGGVNGSYVHADTNAGYDFHLRLTLDSPVDASSAGVLQLAVRAKNTSALGWQIDSPVIVLEDQNGLQSILTPSSRLLPVDGIAWKLISVPLAGGDGWTMSGSNIDMAHVKAIEIRTDTWDYGFVLSVDALSFKKKGEVCAISCDANCSNRGVCDPASLGCSCDIGAVGANCGGCAAGFVEQNGACVLANDGAHSEWPNATSAANSDPWLAVHHDEIARLKPRVLVLHFVNKSDPTASTIVERVVAGFADASRYHAYADPTAKPQLEYQIDKTVDLRDGVNGRPPAPTGYPYENSTLYPRRNGPNGFEVDYAALFSPTFAAYYGYPDPNNAGQFLDLCALVDKGLIHEVWMVGSGDVPDAAAAEVLENKPRYTASGTKIPNAFEPCAGNGCFAADVPSCGRSVRIGFVNYNRGPGCYMHSQGHGMESYATRVVMPGFSEWFMRFAAFDLDRKYSLPFWSLYNHGCASPPCVTFPAPEQAVFTTTMGTVTIQPYDGVCGNVHFPPNGSAHYDYTSDAPVLSSCAAFGENDLACGVDKTAFVNKDTWAAYETMHNDCGGGFLTWWYQSMPAFGAKKTFADGRKMKSVWPYLFY